jgi:HK97 gp10 family phage protein
LSFNVDFKIEGLGKLQKQLANISENQRKEMKISLGESVLLVHSEAVKSIMAHKSSGYTYGKHTASKPGYPPNSDTGRLVRSINWEVDDSKLVGLVGTNLKYGAWLEFGTKDMEARPWLSPAFKKNIKMIVKLITKGVKEALK